MNLLKKILRAIVIPVIALLLVFEEWGWEPLAALFMRLARLPLWAWVERQIAQLPPWAALLAFGLPMLAILPIKLLALYLFGQGHATLGLALLIGAKVGGTAFVARLFQLTQPALMQLGWFARWYPRWKAWKDRVLTEVRQSAPWRMARRLKIHAKVWWASLRSTD